MSLMYIKNNNGPNTEPYMFCMLCIHAVCVCLYALCVMCVLFQFVQRVLIMFMPPKYQPDYMYLRHVPLRRVHLFTAIQIICLIGLWVIKTIKQISIIFPLMVCIIIFTVFCSSSDIHLKLGVLRVM